jgi:hypothetical protein
MKRFLAVVVTVAASVAVAVPSAVGAKAKPPLKAKSNGWYVFDGKPPTGVVPKGGTNTRCVNDPNTPPVNRLGARYSILNRSAPKGTKHILNGPGGLHIVHSTIKATQPGAYYHNFRASNAGQSSFGPGKYTYKMKVKGVQKTSESITLVDDSSC